MFLVGCITMHAQIKSDAHLLQDTSTSQLDVVKKRREIIANTILKKHPVLVFNSTNAIINEVQQIAIDNGTFTKLYSSPTGKTLFNEIFNVYKALPSDENIAGISSNTIYRIELYNYAYNSTIIAYVDHATKKVINAVAQLQSAPDVPAHLKDLAIAIAINHPQIKKELGYQANASAAEMASTKTALNNSKCERSLHLCVAPTFVKDQKALWAIVDLTDLHIVGTKWTFVGDPGPVRITEKTIQNEEVSNCYCNSINTIDKNNWRLDYNITSSDGLRIANVSFGNKKILKSAKLVDWHVSYSNSDGFGYSDGIGCPTFSSSAVLAVEPPQIIELKNNKNETEGFVLEQKFYSEGWPRACNYNYVQRYEFYNDGRFRISTASIGRGCGNDGTYRPVFRIVPEGKYTFSEYNNNQWQDWTTEQYSLQTNTSTYTKEGFAYKLNGSNNMFIEPSYGQFNDKGRGDNAWMYVTKWKVNEGESDLITIGPCCNIDYQQGPEKCIEKENIKNESIVLWYVPQMKNDDTKGKEYCWAEAVIENGVYRTITYPCFAGPMFYISK
jgi:hypothetical protein